MPSQWIAALIVRWNLSIHALLSLDGGYNSNTYATSCKEKALNKQYVMFSSRATGVVKMILLDRICCPDPPPSAVLWPGSPPLFPLSFYIMRGFGKETTSPKGPGGS